MLSRFGELMMYEDENLEATVAYCQPLNSFLKDTPKAEVVGRILERVQQQFDTMTPEQLEQGMMFQVFNVYFIIDLHEQPGIQAVHLPMREGQQPAKYVVNFFVRMGRELRRHESAH